MPPVAAVDETTPPVAVVELGVGAEEEEVLRSRFLEDLVVGR